MYRNDLIKNPINPQDAQYQRYAAMARTAMQAILDKMEKLLKSLKDTKAETETVTDNSVTKIETPLNTISITS